MCVWYVLSCKEYSGICKALVLPVFKHAYLCPYLTHRRLMRYEIVCTGPLGAGTLMAPGGVMLCSLTHSYQLKPCCTEGHGVGSACRLSHSCLFSVCSQVALLVT